jgi:hypothetical protein
MATPITRYEVPVPDLGEDPNIPEDMRAIVEAIAPWLCRAFPATSTSRPPSPPVGMLIRETDTGARRIWNGTEWELWSSTAGGGGGGGGDVSAFAAFTGVAQSVGAGQVVCSFPNTEVADPAVERETRAAGHQFKLEDGLWRISTTVRWATSPATGERYAGVHLGPTGGGNPIGGSGSNPPGGTPTTLNVSVEKVFTTGQAPFISLWNGTGGTRTLEPGPDGASTGGWVRVSFTRIGT